MQMNNGLVSMHTCAWYAHIMQCTCNYGKYYEWVKTCICVMSMHEYTCVSVCMCICVHMCRYVVCTVSEMV